MIPTMKAVIWYQHTPSRILNGICATMWYFDVIIYACIYIHVNVSVPVSLLWCCI